MYEAPDRYKRLISARLPGGESAGLAARGIESESSPLRDVQLISRAQLAPFFAAANIVAALMMAANLWDVAPPTLAVALGGLRSAASISRAMQLAAHPVDHLRRPLRPPGADVDAGRRGRASRARSGSAFRSICSRRSIRAPRSSPPRSWPALASARSAWSSSRRARPPGWSASPCGVGGSLLLGRHTVPFQHMLSILFTLGVAIFGVLTVARWAFHQLKTNADVGSQSESASLLLQEYEQRGVGWLWQVDGENRVTYISSRMSALLGKPGRAAHRPFASRLARRPCRARPRAARKAAVQFARDGT